MTRLSSWVSAALLVAGCATVQKPEEPPPPRPEERSSLDVLLRHRSELQLTEDQVERLERLDDKRESEVAALRTELAERKRAHQEGSGAKGPASGSNAPPPGMSSRGMGGAGTRGRGMGGGMGRGQGSVAPRDPSEFERIHQKIDDADTRAFVDAHSMVLTEAQRPTAEKLASEYRAALFDYREEMRKRHPGIDPD